MSMVTVNAKMYFFFKLQCFLFQDLVPSCLRGVYHSQKFITLTFFDNYVVRLAFPTVSHVSISEWILHASQTEHICHIQLYAAQ